MNRRFLLPIFGFALFSLALAAEPMDQFLRFEGLTSRLAGTVISLDNEIVEYKDGDDSITHKRPGKAKYKNIVLKRGFAGESPAFDTLMNAALKGQVAGRTMTLVTRQGGESDTEEYLLHGDATASLPGTGLFSGGPNDDFGLLMKAKEKANRTKCGNNLRPGNFGKPRKFALSVEGVAVACDGWSPIEAKIVNKDWDGDSVPDHFEVNSSHVTFVVKVPEADLKKWDDETGVKALDGNPSLRTITCTYGLSDGWVAHVDMACTLISYTPRPNGTFDVTCATEALVFRPARGEVKGG